MQRQTAEHLLCPPYGTGDFGQQAGMEQPLIQLLGPPMIAQVQAQNLEATVE